MKNRVSRIIDGDLDKRKERFVENMLKVCLVLCLIGCCLCYGLLVYLSSNF
ncbi:hypothetical protein [Flavobacterium sp.]|uniref:hypothetical protein n=1 Tax=Flavobacterium sp. TaxID=239 RepID=UPI0025C65C12|nr:hypothetical protein [Flavobacterium sp.]